MTRNPKRPDSQKHAFEETARSIGCDESEAAFNAALGKIARHKPVSDPRDAVPKPAKPKKTKPAK